MSTAGKKTRRIFDQRFELVGELGRGKKSVVYHALHDGKEDADVALKVLLPVKTLDPLKSRLRAEAQAMLMAQHPYVLGLKDFQYYENLSYIALEYAPLGDLRKYAKSCGGKIPFSQVELFIRQIAEALHFVHSLGLIHRDVKPDNILAITPDEVRLADFGVALIQDNPGISADLSAAIGTMDYLSPEVLDGKEYGPQGDIYSLGITAYELISGVHPFADLPLAKMMEARLNGPQPLSELVPNIAPSLATTIDLMLESDVARRFKKASEIIDSLNSPSSRKVGRSKNEEFFKDDGNVKVNDSSTLMVKSEKELAKQDPMIATSSTRQVSESRKGNSTLTAALPTEDSSEEPHIQSTLTLNEGFPYKSEELDPSRNRQSLTQNSQEKVTNFEHSKDSLISSAIWGQTRSEPPSLGLESEEESDDFPQEDHLGTSQGLIPGSLRTQRRSDDVSEGDDGISSSLNSMRRHQRESNEKQISKEKRSNRESKHNSMKHVNEDDSPAHSTVYLSGSRRRSKLVILFLMVLAILLAFAGYQGFLSSPSNQQVALQLEPSTTAAPPQSAKPLKTDTRVASISDLKQGIYAGSITGILTRSPLPLFLEVKESGVFVFLGVQGWTPVRADIISNDRLEVSSNGLVLSLKITGEDFGGTLQELLSGESGTWHVHRQAHKG